MSGGNIAPILLYVFLVSLVILLFLLAWNTRTKVIEFKDSILGYLMEIVATDKHQTDQMGKLTDSISELKEKVVRVDEKINHLSSQK